MFLWCELFFGECKMKTAKWIEEQLKRNEEILNEFPKWFRDLGKKDWEAKHNEEED